MSAPTDQFTEFATDLTSRTQDVVSGAVRGWADTLQGYAGSLGTPTAGLADVRSAVDRYFDLARTVSDRVIDAQRTFALGVLNAGAQAAETVTEQAAKATETVVAQAESVAKTVAEAPAAKATTRTRAAKA